MKIYLILLLLTFAATLHAQGKSDFIGNWMTADSSAIVEIYMEDDSYYARIKTAANHEINEKVVLIQMIKKSDTQLYGGTYYDSELKSEYEAKLKLKNNNTIQLKVLYGLFPKTIIWHRMDGLKGKTNEIAVSGIKQ
jgi:uncharacterized protein (DUF2147 family)